MPWPNFFVIGAQKSATSSLHAYLAQHPDVFMSPVKEPSFFSPWLSMHGSDAPPRHALPSWLLLPYLKRAPTEAARLESYLRLFDRVVAERAIGESSTAYLFVPGTAENLHKRLPHARIIAVLRHPVDRAYSHFLQNRRLYGEPLARFEDAVAAESERTARGWGPRFQYLGRGRYAEQLERYLARFPREQISLHLYDDFVREPRELLRALFRFLEVDESIELDLRRRHNEATALPEHQRIAMLSRLLNEPNRLKALFKRLVANPSVRHRLRRTLHSLNRRAGSAPEVPALSTSTRSELTERLRADIERLAVLLDRDLGHWLAA